MIIGVTTPDQVLLCLQEDIIVMIWPILQSYYLFDTLELICTVFDLSTLNPRQSQVSHNTIFPIFIALSLF